jgi:beta-glucanase (GH16 family)
MLDSVPDPDAQATQPYTSAKLHTKGKVSLTYGKIEVRAKLPQGQGVWPAIWMLPEDDQYGAWAASGEIDILEAVNLGVECDTCEEGGENTILGTLHFGGVWPENLLASTEVSRPEVLDGFHTFGVIWEPGRFQWTFDGTVYAEKRAEDWSTTGSVSPNAPFDQNFYLILNLAIGGKLPEGRGRGGVSRSDFPKRFEIDWVRIWQCDSRSISANRCEN